MADFDEEIDVSGLRCPIPIFRTRRALDEMNIGEVLHIIADDPVSTTNFPEFVKMFPALELLESRQEGDVYHYLIKVNSTAQV